MSVFKPTIAALLFSALSIYGYAAEDGKDDSVIVRFDRRFAQLDSLIAGSKCVTPNVIPLNVAEDSTYMQAIDEVTASKIAASRAKTGLEIYGQAYYRHGSTTALDLDGDEIYYGYLAKAQVGIRWNFLQSSIFGRKIQDNIYRKEGSLHDLEHQKDLQKSAIEKQRKALRRERDRLLGSALRELSTNYTMLKDAYVNLYDNDNVLAEKIVDIIRDKDETERKIAALDPSAAPVSGLPKILGNVVRIDTLSYFKQLEESPIDIQLLRVREELLGQQAQNTTWASQASISPFVNYSTYFRTDYPNSGVLNAGISFSLPVNSTAKRTKSTIEKQRVQVDMQTRNVHEKLVSKARNIVESIETINRSIVVETTHLKSIGSYLEERSAAFSAYNGKYDHLARMNGYNIYLQSLIKLVQLSYDRDCLVVDLQEIIGDIPILEFLAIDENE